MAKFTPGPWEWTPDRWNGGYSGIVGKDNTEVLFPNHCNDGDGGAAWFDESPSEADRNLIAAAPDMYEAIRYALEQTIRIEGRWVVDGSGLEPLREALDKAEGRRSE